jgi:hypothetical protein
LHTQRAYPKTTVNGKPFTVSAHFYLAKEKGGGQVHHDPGCDLRTTHTITTIARKSEGFAVIRGGKLQLRRVPLPPIPAASLPGTPVAIRRWNRSTTASARSARRCPRVSAVTCDCRALSTG